MGMSPSYIEGLSPVDAACIHECLPMWTLTKRNEVDAPYGLESIIMAHVSDTLTALAAGLGGESMDKDSMMAPMLSGAGIREENVDKKRQDDIISGLKRTHTKNNK